MKEKYLLEKIGFYKTLLTLSWSTAFILGGGLVSYYSKNLNT